MHMSSISISNENKKGKIKFLVFNLSLEGNVKWIKPAKGRFKCNIDGSFSQHFNRAGIRVCIRDDTDTFVLAKSNGLLQFVRYMLAKLLDCYQLWNGFINYTWDLSILSLMPKKWWMVFHLHVRMLHNLG